MEWLNFFTITFALLNILATFQVSRSRLLRKRQKVVQLVIVWIIPMIGALIILNSNLKNNRKARTASMTPYSGGIMPDSNETNND